MKPRNYYIFWGALSVAVIVPQIVAAFAYHRVADRLDKLNYPVKIEIVEPSKIKLGLYTMKNLFKIFRTKWFRSAPVVATIWLTITAVILIEVNYYFPDFLFLPVR